MIAEADAVLASGHMPARSIIAVFEAAKGHGVRRMIVNHPNFVIERLRTAALDLPRRWDEELRHEYGLPAVVGAAGATATIPDGSRIRIDGAAGTVTLL